MVLYFMFLYFQGPVLQIPIFPGFSNFRVLYSGALLYTPSVPYSHGHICLGSYIPSALHFQGPMFSGPSISRLLSLPSHMIASHAGAVASNLSFALFCSKLNVFKVLHYSFSPSCLKYKYAHLYLRF